MKQRMEMTLTLTESRVFKEELLQREHLVSTCFFFPLTSSSSKSSSRGLWPRKCVLLFPLTCFCRQGKRKEEEEEEEWVSLCLSVSRTRSSGVSIIPRFWLPLPSHHAFHLHQHNDDLLCSSSPADKTVIQGKDDCHWYPFCSQGNFTLLLSQNRSHWVTYASLHSSFLLFPE